MRYAELRLCGRFISHIKIRYYNQPLQWTAISAEDAQKMQIVHFGILLLWPEREDRWQSAIRYHYTYIWVAFEGCKWIRREGGYACRRLLTSVILHDYIHPSTPRYWKGSSEYQPRAIKLSLVDQYVRVFWPFFVCFVWLSLNGSALRGTAAFFFFSPLLPNPKKSSGVAFPDSNVNNKKSEEREKKRLEVLITDHPELRRPIKRTQLATT